MPSQPRLAIFDIDGTLVDSRHHISTAMDQAFVAMGLPAPGYDRTRRIVGLSLVEAVREMAPEFTENERQRLGEGYRAAIQHLRAQPDYREPLYVGALSLLHDLRRQGWVLAAATGKTRHGMDTMTRMHGLEGYFATIGCADDGPSKPDPFMLHKVLNDLQIEVDHAIMIGDTIWDLRMAKAASMRCAGVCWGFHTKEELLGEHPDQLHDDFIGLQIGLADVFKLPRVSDIGR